MALTSEKTLRSIVNADTAAATIRRDALRLADNFDDHVKSNTEELRRRLFDEAEKELAAAAEKEKRQADARIEALDRKLEMDIELANRRFEASKNAVIEKIFNTAVGLDA